MRSVNIARMFEKQENLDELATLLKREAGEVEAIVLPAVFGLNQDTALDYLQKRVGKEICLLPTLPPSVPGSVHSSNYANVSSKPEVYIC